MKLATKEFLAEIDAKALDLKNKILNSESVYPTSGTVYYVSENGDDANDGLSPATAVRTLAKASNLPFEKGDTILLERGGVFRGHLVIRVENITVSAYGKGPKPVINGSPENGAKPHYWSLLEGTDNIYVYYKPLCEIGGICFDDGKKAAIKVTPHFIDGRYSNPDKTVFDVKSGLKDNYSFFCEICTEIVNGFPAIHDFEKHLGKLYLRCDEGNPGEVFESIEFFARGNTIGPCADYLTVDNICLKYCGTHSIGCGNRNGLTVRNTEIGWGGGCIQFYTNTGYPVRFGNGIEIYVGCKDFTVENCYIYQIYDAGVTHQYKDGPADGPTCKHENVTYRNNLIEYCIYNIEYFLEQTGHEDQIMKNVIMEGNILRFAGYGWGSFYSRAAHIKGWDHRNISENFVIRNNIFDRSRSMVLHCGVQEAKHLPVMSGNTYIHFADDKHNLGRFGERGCTYAIWPSERLEYNDENILNVAKDDGAEIYYVTEEHECPGFWPSGMSK